MPGFLREQGLLLSDLTAVCIFQVQDRLWDVAAGRESNTWWAA